MTDDQPAVVLAGGAVMPLIGFGTWQITGQECYRAVRTALDVGYRHLDTATVYRNEAEVGRALRDSGVPRDEVFVTTKCPGGSDDPDGTLDASLAALGLEDVDLWLVHWPQGERVRHGLWRRLVAAREAGRTRAIGVSNYSPAQIDELTAEDGVTPQVNQIPWAPPLHDPEVLAAHRERDVVVEGYSPFKKSDLDDPVLRGIAEAHGVQPTQVILRWHLEHGIVVIPKSVTPERIAANHAVTGFSLSADEVARVDGLAGSGRMSS
jgi:diketogulonate reductase-like aldo/keto reductase